MWERPKGRLAVEGVNFAPPFYLVGTLMVAPIAWTSLQWASYSVEQGGEIKNAHVFRNQLFIIVGSLAVTAGLLALLAVAMRHGIGQDGILTASSGYWLANGAAAPAQRQGDARLPSRPTTSAVQSPPSQAPSASTRRGREPLHRRHARQNRRARGRARSP